MNDLKNRLTSRTFWVTLFTVGIMVLNEQYQEASAIAIAYILGEKAVDTFSNKVVVTPLSENGVSQNVADDDYVPDLGKVVTGKDTPLYDETIKED